MRGCNSNLAVGEEVACARPGAIANFSVTASNLTPNGPATNNVRSTPGKWRRGTYQCGQARVACASSSSEPLGHDWRVRPEQYEQRPRLARRIHSSPMQQLGWARPKSTSRVLFDAPWRIGRVNARSRLRGGGPPELAMTCRISGADGNHHWIVMSSLTFAEPHLHLRILPQGADMHSVSLLQIYVLPVPTVQTNHGPLPCDLSLVPRIRHVSARGRPEPKNNSKDFGATSS